MSEILHIICTKIDVSYTLHNLKYLYRCDRIPTESKGALSVNFSSIAIELNVPHDEFSSIAIQLLSVSHREAALKQYRFSPP